MKDIRPGETKIDATQPSDAVLSFIGRISTPFKLRADCPRQGRFDGPPCKITVFEPWVAALDGIERYEVIDILYWLDKSRRDLVTQSPKSDGRVTGTFALRSPVRPNPIGISPVLLEAREGAVLRVRGLDCLDGTPLIDIKPSRCDYSPAAPPKPGAD